MRWNKPPSDEGGGCQRQTEGEKKPPRVARGGATKVAEGINTLPRFTNNFSLLRAHAVLSLPLEGLAPAGAVSSATAMGGS